MRCGRPSACNEGGTQSSADAISLITLMSSSTQSKEITFIRGQQSPSSALAVVARGVTRVGASLCLGIRSCRHQT